MKPEIKKKSKVYLSGLEQGLKLANEKRMEKFRKVLYMLVLMSMMFMVALIN